MMISKSIFFLGLSLTLLSVYGFAQAGENVVFNDSITVSQPADDFMIKSTINSSELYVDKFNLNQELGLNIGKHANNISYEYKTGNEMPSGQHLLLKKKYTHLHLSLNENEPFIKNRRNLYSSVWAFASLNNIYADLIGLMDKNTLSQYQNGVVNGIQITPNFLATAAVFMQVPLANVFLPQLIKNEKTLRWVQIASGSLMTLVQAGTLFVGKPSPHYLVFSAFEIAATTFITIDAIKWRPKSNKKALKFLLR